MYLKIYFGNKPVFLCDEVDASLNDYLQHPDTIFVDEVSPRAIKSLLHEINKPEVHAGILWGKDLDALKKMVWKNFTIIEAAGGVVINEKKELLLIFRKGKWDLPKGKKDLNETIEACALRETMEETGIQKVSLTNILCTTYHTYLEFGKLILKDTKWFTMLASSKQILTPQADEGIVEICWVAPKNLDAYLTNTYHSVYDVLMGYLKNK